MSRGYFVPCAPFLYLVPDGGGAQGMDCVPLPLPLPQTLPQALPQALPQPLLPQRPSHASGPGPFHYLINEQAKSLVALQELQNEVGALLEFRDLVMETFPHLQQKMVGSGRGGGAGSGGGSSVGGRPWEPGHLRKKPHPSRLSHLLQGGVEASAVSLGQRGRKGGASASGSSSVSVSSCQPKSSDGSAASSTGSSAVQDSGFGTETSSSKDLQSGGPAPTPAPTPASTPASTPAPAASTSSASAPAAALVLPPPRVSGPLERGGGRGTADAGAGAGGGDSAEEAEDELWSLLDVIQRKGSRLRDEVQQLQRRLQEGEVALGLLPEGGGSAAGVEGGGEVAELRRERDFLLHKVSTAQAQLQDERTGAARAQRQMQEQLRVALEQKAELNARIHDLHLQFVAARPSPTPPTTTAATPLPTPALRGAARADSQGEPQAEAQREADLGGPWSSARRGSSGAGRGAAGSTLRGRGRGRARGSPASAPPSLPASPSLPVAASSLPSTFSAFSASSAPPAPAVTAAVTAAVAGQGVAPLGALDGVVSSPLAVAGSAPPDARAVAAILREFNPLELQRHLLTTTAHNKVLQKELAKASKSVCELFEQLDKIKDENDDLRFLLEERNIELEGTRARVRVLERLQQKTAPVLLESQMLPSSGSVNSILPLLALPMPDDDNIHHSSSTESAHDHVVSPQSSKILQHPVAKTENQQLTPKKRPSKIPLPGAKTQIYPKPPCGKIPVVKRRESPSGRSRGENLSLTSKSVRDSLWKCRGEVLSSHGGRPTESSVGARVSSLSAQPNNKESLSGNRNRDSLSAKSHSDSLNSKKNPCDSVSSNKTRDTIQSSLSSNSSNKRDSISSKGKDTPFSSPSHRKGHQLAVRRISNPTINRSNLIDPNDSNSKVLTASDSLEQKLSSSLASNTHAEIADEVLDELGDSFSDSLNNIPNEEPDYVPFVSPADPLPPNSSMLTQYSSNQALNSNYIQNFPWQSSSSEYFDSINNSGSMFNYVSLLRSCSYYQEHPLVNVSCSNEATESDSLEQKQTDENCLLDTLPIAHQELTKSSRENGS